jgi:hypothetical protein
MTVRSCAAAILLFLVVYALGIGQAPAPGDSGSGSGPGSSIGELLGKGHPVHILYVHGIAATGPGDSHAFLTSICRYLPGCKVPSTWNPAKRDYANFGQFKEGEPPPNYAYLGEAVWKSSVEWSASDPFVDHYLVPGSDSKSPVVVDEINWWPLVFPLKCEKIMPGEAHLAGPDAGLLDLCSHENVKNADPNRFDFYQWLPTKDADAAKKMPGEGARVNRELKNNPLDWGFSDAMMAVGPMRELFREAMRQLFLESVRFGSDGTASDKWKEHLHTKGSTQQPDREFVVVSHSLGSYLAFLTINADETGAAPCTAHVQSAAQSAVQSDVQLKTGPAKEQEEDDAAQYIFERTPLLYFFANQVPLLELANLTTPGSFQSRLVKWKCLRENFQLNNSTAEARSPSTQPPKPPAQIVAFSDPSDLLSWYVPPIADLMVTNVTVRNTGWHWLLASPQGVHGNYAINDKEVIRVMMKGK